MDFAVLGLFLVAVEAPQPNAIPMELYPLALPSVYYYKNTPVGDIP
jgi:hypothetical protein